MEIHLRDMNLSYCILLESYIHLKYKTDNEYSRNYMHHDIQKQRGILTLLDPIDCDGG